MSMYMHPPLTEPFSPDVLDVHVHDMDVCSLDPAPLSL